MVSKKRAKPKNWDKEADKFSQRSAQDEYHENLFSKMRISEADSILDLGCGEGSITIPIAKKTKKVTAIDSSKRMLEILESKCIDENINNVKIIKGNLETVTKEEVGKHDIVLLSRSINGIYKIKETLANINSIANKYVYITIFGPDNWKFEKDFYALIDKEDHGFAPYNYLFNILVNMEIYPNVENLEIKTNRTYDSIDDAIANGKWNLDNFTEEEKDKLYDYLKKNLTKNENGKLENPNDKSDWILIWWKK
ncbi:class I SAM-dependent methyltransferase [Methanobrevibacter sp. TMH8]|uniref:class I SAM-dependent methyltransferase n=1 Tax=Methanobrevibacter sp. TMH8 TaxID=2848611 RepID=UPI001CCDF713